MLADRTVSGGCRLKSLFLPDRIFGSFDELTPEILKKMNIKALILDIDNTLVTYDDPQPTERVMKWINDLENAGIQTAFVSNNHEQRVETFCRGLNRYYHGDAGKPSYRYMTEALEIMAVKKENAAALGDQLFTDVWAAKRMGIRAFMVPPIKDKTTLFFKFKRLLEKPFIKRYRHLEKRNSQEKD